MASYTNKKLGDSSPISPPGSGLPFDTIFGNIICSLDMKFLLDCMKIEAKAELNLFDPCIT